MFDKLKNFKQNLHSIKCLRDLSSSRSISASNSGMQAISVKVFNIFRLIKVRTLGHLFFERLPNRKRAMDFLFKSSIPEVTDHVTGSYRKMSHATRKFDVVPNKKICVLKTSLNCRIQFSSLFSTGCICAYC